MNLTTLNSKTSLKAEVFDSNGGTAGSGLASLNNGRRWQLDVEGTNNISVFGLTCYDNNMVSGNLLARSSSAAGSYSVFGESNPFTSAGAILPASLSTVNPESGIGLPFSIGHGEKQQAPTASFSFSPQTITTCDLVNFSNTSTNATSYQWTFGDPESGSLDTSFLANPVFLYQAEGVYSVRLIAGSSAGKDTADAVVTVNTCTITGMKNEKNNPLIIHPNPFENQFRIINQASFGHFILTDLCGKIHWQGKQPEQQNFSFLPSGNYLLKATENRKAIFKLMKK
jgi:PKD repeat protein